MNTVTEFFNYFTAITEDRRANPKDDVASVIANATIDGKPIGHVEAMGYYIIVATSRPRRDELDGGGRPARADAEPRPVREAEIRSGQIPARQPSTR